MKLSLLITSFCLVFSNFVFSQSLLVSNAQVRAFIPGTSKSVAYFSIKNQSNIPQTLTSAEIEGIGKVEIHQHEFVDGMMKMSQINSLVINTGEKVNFQPGGLHLMLFNPVTLPIIDKQITLTLHFKNGEKVAAPAQVVAVIKQAENHAHHH